MLCKMHVEIPQEEVADVSHISHVYPESGFDRSFITSILHISAVIRHFDTKQILSFLGFHVRR